MTLLPMIEGFNKCIHEIPLSEVENTVQLLAQTIRQGKRAFICGNGGSGSNADLFVEILTRLIDNRKYSLSFFSLNSSMAAITHTTEKQCYENIFSSQLERIAGEDDLLICISGSGNSPNILNALTIGHKLKMKTVGLTGMDGGKLSTMADIPIIVASYDMEEIESIHTAMIYAIATSVTNTLNTILHV